MLCRMEGWVDSGDTAQVRKMRVDIETCSPLSAGQTVCDIHRRQSTLPENAFVALVCHWLSLMSVISCPSFRASNESP